MSPVDQDFQPSKEDSDCMFIEQWDRRDPGAQAIARAASCRKPRIRQVQGGERECWDDISGKPLGENLVKRARKEEMGEFAKYEV